MDHLILAAISDEVKQLFESTYVILEQVSLASDEMASLMEGISDEKDYLRRSARFLKLLQTFVTDILHSYYNNKSMDGSKET